MLGALLLGSATAGVAGGIDWLIAVATLGTALGTLGLAVYTYTLATLTRQSVQGAEELAALSYKQLEELQAQRAIARAQLQTLIQQAEAASRQASAAADLAQASRAAAAEACKARIDASASLVDVTVTVLGGGEELDPAGPTTRRLTDGDRWYEPQLRGKRFRQRLQVVFKNVGRTPARISFPSYSFRLVKVDANFGRQIDLQPGQAYEDEVQIDFTGELATTAVLLELPVTYGGLLHGDVFDHLQWNGWVQLLDLVDGQACLARVPLNAAPASVLRSYPNLDQPEEMAQARARLLDPLSLDPPPRFLAGSDGVC